MPSDAVWAFLGILVVNGVVFWTSRLTNRREKEAALASQENEAEKILLEKQKMIHEIERSVLDRLHSELKDAYSRIDLLEDGQKQTVNERDACLSLLHETRKKNDDFVDLISEMGGRIKRLEVGLADNGSS